MSLERRLQHAARELREVTIEPPGAPSARATPRPLAAVTAVAVPVLFVLSGVLVAAGAFARVTPPTTVPAVVSPDTGDEPANVAPESDHPTASAPTPALVEVGLITDLVRARAAASAPASPTVAPPPVAGAPVTVPGPVSLV